MLQIHVDPPALRHRYEVSGVCKHFRVPFETRLTLHPAHSRVEFAEVGQFERRNKFVWLEGGWKLG